MVKIEEVKERLKERLREEYPDTEISETDDKIVMKTKKGETAVFYPEKLHWEIEQSHPEEWQELIDRRVRMHKIALKPKKIKIKRLVPRLYDKEQLVSIEGKPLTKEQLEEGGLIVLKETPDAFVLLVADTEEAYMSIPKKELLKLMTQREFKIQKAKAKKMLEEMGI